MALFSFCQIIQRYFAGNLLSRYRMRICAPVFFSVFQNRSKTPALFACIGLGVSDTPTNGEEQEAFFKGVLVRQRERASPTAARPAETCFRNAFERAATY